MAAYKDEARGTWYVSFHYNDWTGKNKRKLKRGFRTRKEALEYEQKFLLQQATNLDMRFEDFYKLYEEDLKPKLKLNTWRTKDVIFQKKLIPYFKDKKMNEIRPADIIKWQNEMIKKRQADGKPYKPTYLKTMQSELSAIFNHAVRFYNLRENPVKKAGTIGKVMICLVGLGQDIYDGEVGINEWFRCGIEDFGEWEMYYSPDIFSQVEDKNIDKEMIISCDRCHAEKALHLKTSIRSFRADKQCQFVDALLNNEPETAKEIYQYIFEKYPVYITRDANVAKKWAKGKVRGSQRCGMLACSSAQRLKPEGIYVSTEIDVKNWFLAPPEDLRSSNMMEIIASEFKVQGLEIDWAVVCWDADLRRNDDNTDWLFYSFRGTKWQRRNKPEQQRYLVNSYRVLLTRARQGMVIFVPRGVEEEEDATRDYRNYDKIYEYLISCGIKEL